MNISKALQTLAAVTALVSIAKEAKKDGDISPSDWGLIIANGVAPLLRLHGVEITPPQREGVDGHAFSDRVANAISLMALLEDK